MNKIKKAFIPTILFVLLTSLTSIQLYSSEVQQNTQKTLFLQANEQYKKGEFKKAMELYQKTPQKAAPINYNLGNCAYKLKQYGLALLYWRRAEKNWGFFNRGELVDNITLLKEQLRTQGIFKKKKRSSLVKSILKIKNIALSLIRSIPLIILQIFFLLLWLLIFIKLRFLSKKNKKSYILFLFVIIALSGILLIIRYSFESRNYGVVISKQANLRSGPGNAFPILQHIHEAQEVIIKKESDQYYKIKGPHSVGWVDKKDIKLIVE